MLRFLWAIIMPGLVIAFFVYMIVRIANAYHTVQKEKEVERLKALPAPPPSAAIVPFEAPQPPVFQTPAAENNNTQEIPMTSPWRKTFDQFKTDAGTMFQNAKTEFEKAKVQRSLETLANNPELLEQIKKENA